MLQVPPGGRFLPMTVERQYARSKTNPLEATGCHDRRPHAQPFSGQALLASGKPHQPSELRWADLQMHIIGRF